MSTDTPAILGPLPPATPVPASPTTPGPEALELVSRLMSVLDVTSMVVHDGRSASRVDRVPPGGCRVLPEAADPLTAKIPFESGLWIDGWTALPEAEVIRRIRECRRVFRSAVAVTVNLGGERDRGWWETRFLNGGFRRHHLGQLLTPFEALEGEQGATTLLFSRIPDAAWAAHPAEWLARERDLHMDMLREPGIRSDAHLARYMLARSQVRPGMVVLDVACGLGYGSLMLASGTGARRVHGVDLSDSAIRYARVHYGAGRAAVDFQAGDATCLKAFADGTVDMVVSFETLEHMPNPEALLREFARVLRPGGIFVGSVPNLWIDGEGRNPVPFHFHIYDHDQFRDQLARWFEWRELHRQNAGGGWKRLQGRKLCPIRNLQPTPEDLRDAEWWIAVAARPESPTVASVPATSPAEASASAPRGDDTVAGPGHDAGPAIDAATRIAVLDEEPRHRDLFGRVFERLGVRAECVYGRSPDEILESRPQLILLSREWTPDWRLVAAGARRLGIPVVYVMDGVMEWSYVWNNNSHIRGQGTFLQPMLASDLCVIGRHPARILASLGLASRTHVVGLPRLDGYDRTRVVDAGARPRVLIATARTAGHDPEQQLMTLNALRDLRDWFHANPCADVVWRIAGDLAEELGVPVDVQGTFGEALGRSSALISFPSTCVLEGMLKGLPVAQVEYRPVPTYVATGWEIRSADHIPNVVQELLHPPAARLAHQDACLADELEAGDATERLARVLRGALARSAIENAAELTSAAGDRTASDAPAGRLDFRLVHPELSLFAAAPAALLQYELDATHTALRRVKAERMEERRRLRELAEVLIGAEPEDLGHWSLIEHFSEAKLDARPPGSASVGSTTLAGRSARTLFLHPPARLIFLIPVAAAGRLTFSVGLHPDIWENRESGACRFRVVADGRVVADLVVDPVNRPEDRRWVRGEALVPAAAGPAGAHRIELITAGVGSDAFRWALWRNPMFTWLGSEEAAADRQLRASDPSIALPEVPEHYEPGRTIP